MVPLNGLKKKVREWVALNPTASDDMLREYIEQEMPSRLYVSHEWFIDQSVSWFRYMKAPHVQVRGTPSRRYRSGLRRGA